MSNTLSKIVIFTAGALIGSAVTYKLTEARIKKLMQEELEAVREFYGASENEIAPEESDDEEVDEEEYPDAPDEYYEKEMESERSRYRGIMKEEGYSEEEDEDDMNKPYVIRPEEFGEEGYVQQSLTYYADGVITNERGKIIKNVDELIGINPEDQIYLIFSIFFNYLKSIISVVQIFQCFSKVAAEQLFFIDAIFYVFVGNFKNIVVKRARIILRSILLIVMQGFTLAR